MRLSETSGSFETFLGFCLKNTMPCWTAAVHWDADGPRFLLSSGGLQKPWDDHLISVSVSLQNSNIASLLPAQVEKYI